MPEGCVFTGVGVMVLPSIRTFAPVCAGNQNVPDNGASPSEWVTVVMIVPPVLRCSRVKRCRPIRQSSSLNRSSVPGLVRSKVEEQVAIPAERAVPGVDAGPVLAPFPEGPGVHFGELLPASGQVRRIGVRSHFADRGPERVALGRQGPGVPRADVDAGKIETRSEVQEHPGIPLCVEPSAVGRIVRCDGELAVVQAGQVEADRAGVRMGLP